MSRFTDILKANELKQDLDNYLEWLAKSQAEKKAAYATASAGDQRLVVSRESGAIIPFKAQTDEVAVRVSVIASGGTLPAPAGDLVADIAQYHKTAAQLQTSSSILITGRFKKQPAFMTYKLLKGVKSGTSRLTKRAYSSRHSDSASHPFGKNIGTDDEAGVLAALRAKADTWLNGSTDALTRRVYFKPEGQIGIN